MDFFEKINRQKLQRITLIVISALTLLAVVLLLIIIIGSVEGGTTPIDDKNIDKDVIDNIDEMKFENTEIEGTALLKGSLVLSNESHTYTVPDDSTLISIYNYRNEHSDGIPYSVGDIYNLKLNATAAENAHNMLVALGNETGNDSIMIASSYGKQDSLIDINTGYTMVLTVAGSANAYLSDESNADLANWLTDNAHKYGFVVRYPADKSEITGVQDYTHAYRYVGIPHAQYMKDNGLCLEEYIDYLKENTSYKKTLTVKASDGATYSIYFASVSNDGGQIKVPVQTPNPDGSTNYPYTVSGTNAGGVVVTIKVN